MAIRFEIDDDGERAAVVDTVRDLEEVVGTPDCPSSPRPRSQQCAGLLRSSTSQGRNALPEERHR